MTVKELQDELRTRDLPISGRKSQLITRLEDSQVGIVDATILSANDEKADFNDSADEFDSIFRRSIATAIGLPIPVLIIASLLVASTLGAGVYVIAVQLFSDDIEYDLIEYDGERARGFAQALVDLGNPGRHSGTPQEGAAADLIIENLSALGFSVQAESHDVSMFEILSEPELSICQPGEVPFWNGIAPCGVGDVGQQVTNFEHRVDYVIQGYSGSGDISYADDMEVVYLDNGSENASWVDAAGKIAFVKLEGSGVSANTDLYIRAAQNDVSALLLWNAVTNCGKVEADDCVPIFKSVRVSEIEAENGGQLPSDIPFMMVSNRTGETIFDDVVNGGSLLQIFTDVDNTGTRPVQTPCGTWYGESEEMIVIGGHHDTVYNGPGAVDDTSGTASVLEMAHQFAAMAIEKGDPKISVRFCTWGGEEEGLWGSSAYVEAHKGELTQNLRLYVNLDMNHVDKDLGVRGNSLWLFGNDKTDLDNIKAISKQYQQERAAVADKYSLNFDLLDGDKDGENALPYNSDHGPFAYNLDGKRGKVLVCYGSGSWEYHTYADDMTRFNEESLGVSVVIYGTYVTHLAWG